MLEIIFSIVLISSLLGMTLLIYQKMPLLLRVTEPLSEKINWKGFLIRFKTNSFFKNFSFEIFFQKILSKIRILTLKIDNKISGLLQRLRERTKKKKIEENDNYWKEVKNFKKK